MAATAHRSGRPDSDRIGVRPYDRRGDGVLPLAVLALTNAAACVRVPQPIGFPPRCLRFRSGPGRRAGCGLTGPVGVTPTLVTIGLVGQELQATLSLFLRKSEAMSKPSLVEGELGQVLPKAALPAPGFRARLRFIFSAGPCRSPV